ncbi:hypothetical protein Nmel_007691 [Mimus melanotis]
MFLYKDCLYILIGKSFHL